MRAGVVSVLIVIAALFAPVAAHAVVLISIDDDAGDLLVTAAGEITQNELDRLTLFNQRVVDTGMTASANLITVGVPLDITNPGPSVVNEYRGLSGPSSTFGTQPGTVLSTSGSGLPVGVATVTEFDEATSSFRESTVLRLAAGYTPQALSSEMRIAGASIASLGLTPGTYQWSFLDIDFATLVELRVAPVPAALPLVLTAFGLLAAITFRRRRRRA